MRGYLATALVGLTVWVSPIFSLAQTTTTKITSSTVAPSSPAFEQRLQMCAACHGANGASPNLPNTPSLAGQPKQFLENQMVLIREGMRDIPMMRGVMEGWTDDEIVRAAALYAGQTLKPAVTPMTQNAPKINTALLERGRQLSQDNRCGICHLPSYLGRDQMPRLAGQKEDYLLHSMRMMKNNQAVGRDPLMAASLYGLSDADLVAISHYLSQLK